jgi:hypothetical protein
MVYRQDIVSSLILVPIRSGLRGFCLFILENFSMEYQQNNPLKYYALPFLFEFLNNVHFRDNGSDEAKRHRKINIFRHSGLDDSDTTSVSLKRIASAFPQLTSGLMSEYDKEQFLTLRHPAVLPQGSSLHYLG